MANCVKTKVSDSYLQLTNFINELPVWMESGKGVVIYKGRNQLVEFEVAGVKVVVKAFCKPNFINRIAYGFLRASKAARSYDYAQILIKAGIPTPTPVGYYTERNGLLFGKSYYVCLKSECPYTYKDLLNQDFPNKERFLEAIGAHTAKIHNSGFLHKDYSRGNILFKEMENGDIHIEIIDLNRIKFHKIGLEEGCRNFERLPSTPQMRRIMANAYAAARGFNKSECFQLISRFCDMRNEKF